MKNILVISGSPRRRGNTAKVTRIVEEKMAASGDVSFEYLVLKDLHLDYCRGCMLCMKKGEEHCPCKDDSVMVRDRMLAADGIIFASPVYVHTVTALMKNFYDRFAYLCHQPRFRDKAAMFIVTTELSGAEETLEYMRFPAFTWGFRMSAALGVVYPGFTNEGAYRDRMLQNIERAAGDFYSNLVAKHREAAMRELMFFNLMKTKVTLHRDFLPADYNFWRKQGWLDRDFYTENEIPRFKSTMAKLLVRLKVRKMLKSGGLDRVFGMHSQQARAETAHSNR
jgi:multimeric flavodoxin WrbA